MAGRKKYVAPKMSKRGKLSKVTGVIVTPVSGEKA